jgi:endonuclease/exonuclease/phosphatase family metal-dependent hydrolase
LGRDLLAARLALRKKVGAIQFKARKRMIQPAKPATLRLASYNIQKCVGLDLRRKPRRILNVLDGLGASLVVLQEADKRLPPRPAALPHFVLDEAGWAVADLGGAGSLGWHGNAVIWRGAELELRQMGHIPLPGLEPRGAVWVELDTLLGPLRVVGTHLGLLAKSRRQQVQQLMIALSDLTRMATIIAGDFNDWTKGKTLERWAPDLQFVSPQPSFPSPRPLGALDRIALDRVAQAQGLAVAQHGVYDAQPAQIASDHLPVWADLQIRA